MPSRKMSSTSSVCAAAPLMSAAARIVARLPRARCASPWSSSSASARSSKAAGATLAPGKTAACQWTTARFAWCRTCGPIGRPRWICANSARRSTTCIPPPLLRLDPGLFHELRPLRLIVAYEARELLGRVARGIGSEAEHFLAHVAHREHAIRFGGGLRHRRLRRRRRREQAEPAYRLVARQSRLGEGRKTRQGVRSLRT